MNVWQKFWKSINLPQNSSWEKACSKIQSNKKIPFALKFIAMAYADSQSKGKSNREAMEEIAHTLGFNYTSLYTVDSSFENDLATIFSVVLLKSSSGRRQFMRTIRRYSGKMYVEFAGKIGSAIRKSGWSSVSDPQKISEILGGAVLRYEAQDKDEDANENILSLADTANFFLTLINLYRRYNRPFTVDDILSTDLGQVLTRKVAENIIKTMCSGLGNELSELDDTLPIICLVEKKATLSLPSEGKFYNTEGLQKVVFQFFKESSDETPVCFCRYEEKNGQWQSQWKTGWEKGVSLEAGVSIKYVKKKKIYRDHTEESNVTPQVLNGYDYILLSDDGIVSENSELNVAALYKVLSLNADRVSIKALISEQYSDILIENGFFSIPENAEQVFINGISYDTSCNRNYLINKEERFKYIKQGGVGRLFFERSSSCLTDNALDDTSIEAVYKLDDEREVPFAADENVPAEMLWQRNGRLIINKNGHRLLNCAITFIPDVDLGSLRKSVGYGETTTCSVFFGSEEIKIEVNPSAAVAETFFQNYQFSFPITREGIFFQHKEKGIFLPVKQELDDNENILELAEDDFEYLNLVVNTTGNYNNYLIRGKAFKIFFPEHKREKIHGYCRNDAQLLEETSDFYTIILKNDFEIKSYKIHKYNPFFTSLGPKGESYKLDTNGINHTLSYFSSYYYQSREKIIIAYLAGEQENTPIEITPECILHEVDEKGRCVETLKFKIEENQNLSGLICFAAIKTGSDKYKILSSGFFLQPSGTIKVPEDGLKDFRLALVKMDSLAIQEILMTEDEKLREELRAFIDKIVSNSQRSGICEYLNSFRNDLFINSGLMEKYPSGYLFMAGWYFADQIDKHGRFNANFRKYWDPLMIAYQYKETPVFLQENAFDVQDFAERYCQELNKLSGYEKNVKKLRKLIKTQIGQVENQDGECKYETWYSFSYSKFSEAFRRSVCRYQGDDTFSEFKRFVKNEMRSFIDANTPKRAYFDAYLSIVKILFKAWYKQNNPKTEDFFKKFLKSSNSSDSRFSKITSNEDNGSYLVKLFLDFFPELNAQDFVYYASYPWKLNCYVFAYRKYHGFSSRDLYDFIEKTAKKLNSWREYPDLKTAQQLRETLLQLQELDGSFLAYRETNSDKSIAAFPSLRQVIDYLAWVKHLQNKAD